MVEKPKHHEPAHYAAILRTQATLKRSANPDGYNGLAANLEAAADYLDFLSAEGKIMREALEGIQMLSHGGDSQVYQAAGMALDRVSGRQNNAGEAPAGHDLPETLGGVKGLSPASDASSQEK